MIATRARRQVLSVLCCSTACSALLCTNGALLSHCRSRGIGLHRCACFFGSKRTSVAHCSLISGAIERRVERQPDLQTPPYV